MELKFVTFKLIEKQRRKSFLFHEKGDMKEFLISRKRRYERISSCTKNVYFACETDLISVPLQFLLPFINHSLMI